MVGIRYDRGLRCLQEFSQPPDLVKMRSGASFLQECTVVPIHRQQQIELFEIAFNDRPGPQVGQVVASFSCMHLAPFIWWSARMEIVRARRVDLDPVQERSISQLLEEDSLCRGTSADVAHADKQNPEIRFVHFDLRMVWCCRADAACQYHCSGRTLADGPAPRSQKQTGLIPYQRQRLVSVIPLIQVAPAAMPASSAATIRA